MSAPRWLRWFLLGWACKACGYRGCGRCPWAARYLGVGAVSANPVWFDEHGRPITGPDARPCETCGDHDDPLFPCHGAEGFCEGRGNPPSLNPLDDPRAAFVAAIRRASEVGGCLNPEDGAQALAHVEAAGLRVVPSDGRHVLDCRGLGMTVDGDLLADCIADATPRVISDEAARELAEDALRNCDEAGMTVLRGPRSEPWTPPRSDKGDDPS